MKVTFIKLLKDKSKNKKEKMKHFKNNKDINDIETKTNKIVLKKSQITLMVIALMLMSAGYLNYTNNIKINLAELGDAQLVSANIIEKNEVENNQIEENEVEKNQVENKISNNVIINNVLESNTSESDTVKDTSSNVSSSNEYFAQTKLERETMYSQMLETYQKILENDKIPSDQKSIASNEIKRINDNKNAILIAENLIKTKGFSNVALLINDNSINVVVKQANNLTQEQVAQIENVVSRELKADIEDIHITVHK